MAATCFRRLEIDSEFELRRLFIGKSAGLAPLKYPARRLTVKMLALYDIRPPAFTVSRE
jgi:hypothetical protein